jgi:hypothetical protein
MTTKITPVLLSDNCYWLAFILKGNMPAARFMPHVVRGACTNLFAETKGDKR